MARRSDFAEVVETGDWSSQDILHGEPLVNGEVLDLVWPDGKTTSKTPITVEKIRRNKPDHGKDGYYTDHEAFVIIDVRGVKTSIRLVGSGVKARRSSQNTEVGGTEGV